MMQSGQMMEKPLPEGWRWVKLGEVCIQDRQIIDPGSEKALRPYLGLEHIESNTGKILLETHEVDEKQGKSTTFAFNSHHVLYGKLRPYLNKVALPNFEGRCTTELIPLLPTNLIDRDFFAWLLRREETVNAAMQGKTGSRMPRVDMDEFLKFLIPIPLLQEQQRIAARLREQMQAVDEARQAAEAQLQAAEQLQGAYLREFFDNPEAKQWPRKKLGDYVATYRNGFGRRPKGIESGPIVLRLADVSSGYINLDNPRRVETSSDDKVLYKIKKGDLLFVRVNGSSSLIGRCILVDTEFNDVIYNDHLIRVQLKEGLLPEFLKEVSYFPEVRTAIVEGASTSAGQLTINQSVLSSLLIPLPILKEQEFLLKIIKSKHEESISLRKNLKDQLTAINQLPAALLRQAFSGAL